MKNCCVLRTAGWLMLFLATGHGRIAFGQCAPDTLLATLSNPAPVAGEEFGFSVAISGNLVVVAVPMDDPAATDAGAPYIFNATTGALVTALSDPAPTATVNFGNSVAISGNLAVVGAPLDGTETTDAGTAYVFNATTGALLSTLSNGALATRDGFGNSVAISGNLAVVGAPYDYTGADNAGTAYVFNATTGELVTTFSNPAPAADDYFGNSVAISGNLAVVGAYSDGAGATNAGTAYVFNATTGALVTTLSNPAPAAGDFFGISVSIAGDLAVVGAFYDDVGTRNAGTAYVFNATTGVLVATLSNPTPEPGDNFGNTVAISGRMAIVGANQDNAGATDAGTAYIFDATTGALLATLSNPTPALGDRFGTSVAISENLAIVGAMWDSTGARRAGIAYSFTCTATD